MLSVMQAKYPKLFVSGIPNEFLCEDGWSGLIDELCKSIDSLLADGEAYLFEIAQVKQKFGELRFYVRVRDGVARRDRILELVAKAKVNSLTVCELCGSPGRLEQWRPGSGYWQTLCDRHGGDASAAR